MLARPVHRYILAPRSIHSTLKGLSSYVETLYGRTSCHLALRPVRGDFIWGQHLRAHGSHPPLGRIAARICDSMAARHHPGQVLRGSESRIRFVLLGAGGCVVVDARTATEVGFGGGTVRDYRGGRDALLFHTHLAKDTGHEGRRVGRRGDYETGESVRNVELGAVGIANRRVGRGATCAEPFRFGGCALTNPAI